MRNLSKLRVLRLGERWLESVAGLEDFRFLRVVEADFRVVAGRPSLRQLTKLKTLNIHGWNAEGLGELARLPILEIRDCSGKDELPELRSLIKLRSSWIQSCEFTDVAPVSGLSTLESLRV